MPVLQRHVLVVERVGRGPRAAVLRDAEAHHARLARLLRGAELVQFYVEIAFVGDRLRGRGHVKRLHELVLVEAEEDLLDVLPHVRRKVLVQRGLYPKLMERLVEATEAITIGPGDVEGIKLGPVVSKTQYDKVLAAIEAGKKTDAKLMTGGGRPEGMETGYYIAPTIFAEVPTDAAIWREEVFGPVVCVNPFDTEEEALALANDSPYGLAGAVMSDDLDRCERVAGKLRAGIIWINCSQPTFTQVPWGGYKSSGIGRELGKSGFMGFREIKQITRYDHTRDWGWYLSK